MLKKYHSLDKRLTYLVMKILVRQTEDCDMLLHMVTTDMKLLVVEIEIDDMTADDVDKVSILRHTTSSSDCIQITSRVSNCVARKSTRAQSRGTIGVHKLGDQIGQIGQLILHVLTLSLHISHNCIISLDEREENQEVEFDLTSSEDDSWYFLGCAITTDNFKLKHGLLTLVQNKQFFGHDKEDPHAHV
nr:hypothetical protein [Tanacetum cinerariifolium]